MPQDSDAPVLYEKRPDRIAVITLNRPQALNACNRAMWKALERIWTEFMADGSLSVAVLTGAGDRAFCAGADLKEMAQTEGASAPFGKAHDHPRMLDDWEIDVWKPIVCAVNGYALGSGLSTVMATDIRIAAEHAQFGMSQIKWGIASGTGTQILPRFLPYAIGMELLLTGQNISAQRACEIGLVNKVVPKDKLMDEALAVAKTLAGYAPLALQAAKQSAIVGLHFTLPDALRFGLHMEKLNGMTEDAKEGPRAFAEKRPPQWKGR